MTSYRRRRALSLEELELWLASDHAPAKGDWNVSAVDGFLAGIIVGPEPIAPAEWTRLIFGARRPLGKDGDAAVQAVLDRHEAIARALAEAPASYVPLFMLTKEGVVLAQNWAAGFVAAIRLRQDAWRALLEGPAWMELLLPILVYTPDPTIEAYIARLPAEARHHLAEAYRHIPAAVAALREHFLPARLDTATASPRILKKQVIELADTTEEEALKDLPARLDTATASPRILKKQVIELADMTEEDMTEEEALKEWLDPVPPGDRESVLRSYRSTTVMVAAGLLLVAAVYATGQFFLDQGSEAGTAARPAEVTPAADDMLQPDTTSQTHSGDAAAAPAPAGAPDAAPFARTETSPPSGTRPWPAGDIGRASLAGSSPAVAAPPAQRPTWPSQVTPSTDIAAAPGSKSGMPDPLQELAFRDAAAPPAVPNELLPPAGRVKTIRPPVAKDDPPSDPLPAGSAGAAATPPPASMAGDPVSGTPEAAPAPLADLDGSRNALLTRTAAAPAAGSFAIHLASARDPALVAGEWQRLARRHPSLAGLEPRPPVMIEVPGRGTFYRVVGGVFATRSEAVAACDRLRAQNQYCMVVAP